MELTEDGKMVMEQEYDCSSIKEMQENYFIGYSAQDVIAALNHCGAINECNEVGSFLAGVDHQRAKMKKRKK